MRHRSKLPAILVAMTLQTAAIAPLARTDGGVRCGTMICCRGGKGASCPMHAPSSRTSFRTCPSEADGVARAPRVTLSLPARVRTSFKHHPSEMLGDLVPARELQRPTEPGVPPPERPA